MTTWIQIMAQVRLLDEQRRVEGRLREGDAEQLVTMLIDFHQQAVASTPSREPPSGGLAGTRKLP